MTIQSKETSQLLEANTPPRQAKLRAWLVLNGFAMGELAKRLGVHPSMITRIVKGESAPARRIEQLAELGVPQELLPVPSRPPGRPPGTKNK
ncbi:MAG: helix-turn-helix domain-containing protein [Proteobacteria bacterium]|nr:helix-turn-helix domain-containing protein [Pseudomonadota bacterium]